jgi:hypothetical protein
MTILMFGASGSAGGSVLRVCLAAPQVTEVRAIVRRPLGLSHPRLRELTHGDYENYSAVADAFAGVGACFYCLGKSVRQTSGEAEYRTITYDYALAAARTLRRQSPDAVFHFVSGAGAALDSRFMWARVKAETERDLLAQFGAVCYRPGSIDGMPSASEPLGYKMFRPAARVLLRPFRRLYVTGDDIGLAMLQAGADHLRGQVIPNAAIRDMAARRRHSAA